MPNALKVLVSVQTKEKQGIGVLVSSNGTIYMAAHVVISVDITPKYDVILFDVRRVD